MYIIHAEDLDTWEEHMYDMETVVEEKPISQDRWHTKFEKIVKNKEGKYLRLQWNAGSTEYQESDHIIYVEEVEPYTTLVTKYKTKGN